MTIRERYAFKCPSCAEETLIQRGDTYYECIYCGYKKNLDSSELGVGTFFVLGFILLLILMALIQGYYRSQYVPSTPNYQSSKPTLRQS